MARENVEDDPPEHLLCPICFNLPEGEVYQCVDGHVLCKKCHNRLSECPQCRRTLDKNQPIRCRHLEGLLDEIKVDCCFKTNGCEEHLPKGVMRSHQSNCCYDFKKYGKFVNVCKLIGYLNCDFLVNNGNTKTAVEHFVSQHGCFLSNKAEGFQMDIPGFQKCKNSQSWTPVIMDLKEKKFFLLNMAVFNKEDETVAWFSLFLPYYTNDNFSKSPAQVEYSMTGESSKFTFFEEPITLSKAHLFLPLNLPYCLKMSSLSPHVNRDGTLSISISCQVKSKDEKEKGKKGKVEHYVCKRQNVGQSSSTSKSVRSQLQQSKGKNRGESSGFKIPFLDKTTLAWIAISIFVLWLAFFIGTHLVYIDFFNPNDLTWTRAIALFQSQNPFVFYQHYENLFKEHKNELMPFLHQVFDSYTSTEIDRTTYDGLCVIFLMLTAQHGSLEAIKYLVEVKGNGNLNHVGPGGKTPLFLALQDEDDRNALEKVKILIENGANIMALKDKNISLLHLAVSKSSNEGVELVEYLLKNKIDVNGVDLNGNTPMHLALDNENEEIRKKMVRILLDNGAVVKRNKNGQSPVHLARENGYGELYQMMKNYH